MSNSSSFAYVGISEEILILFFSYRNIWNFYSEKDTKVPTILIYLLEFKFLIPLALY